MTRFLTFALIAIGSFAFSWFRTRRYLRFLQQEQYYTDRYIRWVNDRRALDRRGAVIAIVSALVLFLVPAGFFHFVVALLASLVLVATAFFEEDPEKAGKLRLVMTERATRIFQTALALHAALFLVLAVIIAALDWNPGTFFLASAVVFRFTPWLLAQANLLLLPGEQRIQDGFMNEAKEILRRINPYVIGITGSYGKTSTKMILGDILNASLGPTFRPPKSYNSLMGITRVIREDMKAGTRFAVIEMGAFGVGSIRRLCEFTPPKAAIVTAVGVMHLERFGSPEGVFKAKSELPQAVPEDGIIVGNGDDMNVRRMFRENPKRTTLFYGLAPERGPLDASMKDIAFGPEGTSFTVVWQGREYPGRTKLLGDPNLSNILGAFTLACALGAHPEVALAAIRNIEPVDNRLSVRKIALPSSGGEPGYMYFLDDAYNSNPVGFRAALNTLALFPATRRILVTPGMIELGEIQESENRAIAREAAALCDLVIVVAKTNRDAIVSGLREGGLTEERYVVFDNRKEALDHLTSIQRPGDVVLIENDLPDLYEPNCRF